MATAREVNGRRAVLKIGAVYLRDGVEAVHTNRAVGQMGTGTITLTLSAVADAPLDWLGDAQVLVEAGVETHPLLTGLVDRVEVGETVVVNLVDSFKILGETQVQVAFEEVDAAEKIWSLARMAGLPAEALAIDGFEPRPTEEFSVTAPLYGLGGSVGREFAGVQFFTRGGATKMARRFPDGELRGVWEGGDAWAQVRCVASTLLAAEEEGLARIDLAIAWLSCVSQFSAPHLPASPPRAFFRDWTVARVVRLDAVIVRGETTGRAWFRAPVHNVERPALDLDEIPDIHEADLVGAASTQVREAVLAWRRAMEEHDALAAVLALWDAVEFYVSGTRAKPLTEDATMKRIRRQALAGLTGEVRSRVDNVLGTVNDAPLLARLRLALANDRVPYTPTEFDLLKDLRTVRNDFIHGRERALPNATDRRLAVSLVGRMLVYRMDRLRETTTAT